jgi:acetylornithine deacetylase/succinyl-diaminopimelate desuccinylase-like protein
MVRRAAILVLAWLSGCALSAVAAPTNQSPPPEAYDRAVEIYKTIVEMDTSVEGARVPEMAAYLSGVFKDAGFPADDIHIIPMAKTAAMVVRYRGDGTGGKPILLMAHMDVVPAHREDWTRDPFKFIEENGYFFGRGTEDNKSGVAMLTSAFLTLKKEGFVPTRDLIIAFTGDEETVGLTATALVREHRELIDAEYALNSDAGGGTLGEDGKPQGYSLQTAEKTFASFRLTAHNEGGHSSQPRKDNAIFDVMTAVQALQRYQFPVMWNDTTIESFRMAALVTKGPIGKALKRFAAHPGDRRAAAVLTASPYHVGQVRTTCIPTMLQGGHADNALPQSASVIVNCRIFPGVKIASVEAQLKKLAGVKIDIAPLESNYTSSDASPLRKDVVAAVSEAVHASYPGVPIIPAMSAGATDGVFYRGAGIPTYGVSELFLKDSDDFAHGLNERVPVASFRAGLTHWHILLTTLAGRH